MYRCIDVDYRNVTVWLKYAEMEMKHKFVNHARNVWDRAVTLHPRVRRPEGVKGGGEPMARRPYVLHWLSTPFLGAALPFCPGEPRPIT